MGETIRSLIKKTQPWLEKRGSDTARLDAELLVAHALGTKRLDLFLDLDRPLTDDEVARCRALVVRRGEHEPIAYIVGEREFFGHKLKVTPAVLIPRPETEHLVEEALARTPKDAAGTFVDVCTGSGCVAIALLLERPGLSAVATDISGAALAVARDNAERLGVLDRLTLREGDLLAPVGLERAGQRGDGDATGLRFVVANPPYVTRAEMAELMPDVGRFEPHTALVGEGDDGLGHHRRIVDAARPLLAPGGFIALEIGAGQRAACEAMGAVVKNDLAGLARIAVFER